MEETLDPQRVTGVLDLERVDPGTNLLVTGPAMSGKHEFVLSLLAAGVERDGGSVFVTTRKDAVSSERDFERLTDGAPSDALSVVDCVSRATGFGRPESRSNREYVTDPGDLTGIGIGATQFLRRYYQDDRTVRLGVHSVSTMLMYADLRRTFRFLHTLTGRIRTAGFVGVFALEDTVNADERGVLEQPFDGLVELRETDEGRDLRCRGVDVGPRTWTPVTVR
jgi:KaiC/GvpD/RAD55 family RecA-like ATPase